LSIQVEEHRPAILRGQAPNQQDLDLTENVKALALDSGADLIGVADLCRLQGIATHPPDLLVGFRCAISVGVVLQHNGSNGGGAEETAFSRLDDVSRGARDHLRERGYRSIEIPPDGRAGSRGDLSRVGAISHKAVARAAGLGWIGRSTLLVTPRFGPRVCLTTLLSDAPLAADYPTEEMCGTCRRCVEVCPAGALGGQDRNGEWTLDIARCGSWLDRAWYRGEICYECMLACPWGRSSPAIRQRGRSVDAAAQAGREDSIPRLHNAWLGREEECSQGGHRRKRSRVIRYGSHIQSVCICDTCFKTGKGEHRQLARNLMA
jgi:epoxyqueuosine reductase QueG